MKCFDDASSRWSCKKCGCDVVNLEKIRSVTRAMARAAGPPYGVPCPSQFTRFSVGMKRPPGQPGQEPCTSKFVLTRIGEDNKRGHGTTGIVPWCTTIEIVSQDCVDSSLDWKQKES